MQLSIVLFSAAAALGEAFVAPCGGGAAQPRVRAARAASAKGGAGGRVLALAAGNAAGVTSSAPEPDELDAVRKKIAGVEAALGGADVDAGIYAGREKTELWVMLVELQKEKNLLLQRLATASRLSTTTARAPPATVLGLEHFLSIEDLKKKSLYKMAGQPEPDQQVKFVGMDYHGKPWLESTYADIEPLIAKEDTPGRVSPAALIGCSRSGKTRALVELGAKLRGEGKNVIFVSFNEKTSFVDGESSSRLESLLARIAYAIAKHDATSRLPLHDDSMEQITLRFTTTKKAVLTWLEENKDNDIVLLMDELNKCVGPDIGGSNEVVRFLRDYFVSTPNRYYVFSTHVSSTNTVVLTLGQAEEPSSDRTVHRVGMPLVTTRSDWDVLTKCTTCHPAWFGLSPGLMYTAVIEDDDTLPAKWNVAYEGAQELLKDGLYDAVLLDLFSPDSQSNRNVVSHFEQFARCLDVTESSPQSGEQSKEKRVARRSWAPMALYRLFDKVKKPPAGTEATRLLATLRETEIDAGKAWEIALACALILRVEVRRSSIAQSFLSSSLYVRKTNKPHEPKVCIFPDGLVECNATLTWSFARPQDDLEEVLASFSTYQPKRPEARFVRPATVDFEKYDLLLVFYPKNGGYRICGYQCKKGYDMNVGDPVPTVRSFLVQGAAKDRPSRSSNAATSGWIVLTKAEINALMGPTFAPILDFEDALSVGASNETTVAADAS